MFAITDDIAVSICCSLLIPKSDIFFGSRYEKICHCV